MFELAPLGFAARRFRSAGSNAVRMQNIMLAGGAGIETRAVGATDHTGM